MPEPREIDVAHVARLARLNLTAEEIELFQKQLERVLEYAEKLREPDTSRVDDDIDRETIFDILREDEPRDWFTAKEALSNAPRQANDLFVVPKVVE
jgi:aspartyl-tRNA(Asn)/glutamyl-tRNA(Gln) amidotransferase subunit C